MMRRKSESRKKEATKGTQIDNTNRFNPNTSTRVNIPFVKWQNNDNGPDSDDGDDQDSIIS